MCRVDPEKNHQQFKKSMNQAGLRNIKAATEWGINGV